ncbi:MAG TPA: citrate (Si)-synthase [Candidatus Omnitrophica bacterium]|nr:MAG: citrate (Si)-synthase [Omnitrophica WOR_2 bacterium GWA2_45_18]HBR14333.1 citrate (Si)-synthase [Candidatus Omnitrophota bacterium]
MEEKAKIILDGKTFEFPIIVGTENEKAIDITNLRSETSYITLDNGFGNTGSCTSGITFLDGETGILRYRGIPIEQMAEKSTFVETSYLLIYGEFPQRQKLDEFAHSLKIHADLHPDMLKFFDGYPTTGHPMGLLSAMVCSLSGYYPELLNTEPTQEDIRTTAAELLSKVCTITAYTYKKSMGEPFVAPRRDFEYIPNFLHMMFSSPHQPYKMMEEVVSALETVLILHADHEQNCSTSTVRLVGSSWANLFASISAGVCALWGPLHGGANQQVVEMFEEIQKAGGDIQKFIDRAKDPKDSYRLMGFGHRVYKNFDPRSKIIKEKAHELFAKLGIHDPLLDIAVRLEEAVLKDDYFTQRKLYPNVDFYSGIIYRAIGIPTVMFPVMFAIGRMPGWIAHWKEMKENSKSKIGRPRQIYTGERVRDYIPMEQR